MENTIEMIANNNNNYKFYTFSNVKWKNQSPLFLYVLYAVANTGEYGGRTLAITVQKMRKVFNFVKIYTNIRKNTLNLLSNF